MSLPNKITLSRIILGPLFSISHLNRRPDLAFYCLFLNWFFDVLDGFLARRRKEITKMGELLDPIVDLSFFLFVIIAFSLEGITQINWFLIPIIFIGLAFIVANSKNKKIKTPHTKIKILHAGFIYIMVVMILFEANYETFLWITFIIFSLSSGELFFRSLNNHLRGQSLVT